MSSTDSIDELGGRLDDVAWQFLASEFTAEVYAVWSIDRRLDAFLRHQGYRVLHHDGSVYDELLDRVMANISAAARAGALPQRNSSG